MHRSGSSVFTRGLQAIGVDLGENLMPPVAGNNDKGFFEDMDLYRLNERLLSKSQSAWHRLAPLDAANFAGPAFSAERREATTLLRAKIHGSKPFAFKDPRTAILMPFWRCVFEDLGLDDRYLITLRHPLETAASLHARDKLPLTKGVLLWAKHMVEALRQTEGKSRVLARYDDILDAPERELRRIAAALQLPTTENSEALAEFRSEFLTGDLRHHRIGKNELRRSGVAPEFVIELFDELLVLARESSADTARWRSIVVRYDQSAPILAFADELDKAGVDATKRADNAERSLAEKDKSLAEKGAAVEAAGLESARLRAAISEEQKRSAAAADTLKKLEARLEELQHQCNAATQDAVARAHEIAALEADRTRARDQLALADAAIAQATTDFAALLARHEAGVAKIAQQSAVLSALEEDLAQARASGFEDRKQLERARTEIGALSPQITLLETALQQQRSEAEAREEQLRADLLSVRQVLDAARLDADMEQQVLEVSEGVNGRTAAALQEARAEIVALQSALAAAQERAEQVVALSVHRDTAAAMQSLHTTELEEARAALSEALRKHHQEREEGAAALQSERDALAATQAAQAKDLKQARLALSEALRKQQKESEEAAAALINARRDHEKERNQLSETIAQHQQALNAAQATERRLRDDLSALRDKLEVRERARRMLRRDLLLARAAHTGSKQTLSWKITAPLRGAARVARNPALSARIGLARAAQAAWHLIPIPPERRGQLAGKVFTAAPALFSWSGAYKRWKTSQEHASARAPTPPASEEDEPADTLPEFETYVPLLATEPPKQVLARTIAFYLPQFHRIPENDAWWGEGFTEWTKVRASTPRYPGHYQPHEPDTLGYYDLLQTPQIMARQAELAKLHGISGFCFYFYWFAGKRLLETPLQNLLGDSSIDLPFCLCWANENWTRRWDGKEQEILIGQEHSESDDIAFISHVSQYFADPRYIRIADRPLLVVYRPALLPDARQTAQRWRAWLRKNGFGEIYLAYTQSFENAPPEHYGFDAAIEFPPNNKGLTRQAMPGAPFDQETSLNCYDWRKLEAESRSYSPTAYRLFRSVNPSWDNTPRRPRDGAVLLNSSPALYRRWLNNAAHDTIKRFDDPQERLVFVNAWNEWAEGAHLEPDKRYGHAWLEATRNALTSGADRPHVLVVSHDLYRHGAQYLALSIAKALRDKFGCRVTLIAGKDGPLVESAKQDGPLLVLDPALLDGTEIDAAVASLAAQGYRHAIINSAASAWLSPVFAKHGIAHIGLVHEMASMIESRELAGALQALDMHARAIVFPADIVRDSALAATGLHAWSFAAVRPQGLYKSGCLVKLEEKEHARQRLAKRLGVSADARFVLGVGYADARKGADIFADWAAASSKQWSDVHFVWIGDVDPAFKDTFEASVAAARARGAHIHLLGFIENTADFYAGASLYALTSREDPFPSTALEALAAATPVITIRGAGGIEELSAFDCAAAIEASPIAFVEAAKKWLDVPAARQAAGLAGRDLVATHFGSTSYVGDIADRLGLDIPNVSVVVPNYNYAHCLEQRLRSILDQTLAPREIIVIDDASTDKSIAVVERVLSQSSINWRIVRNAKNSGSVFAQWRKGAELAQGELLWIAEADDWADPRFLETAARTFRRADVVLSMTQSKQADVEGRVIAEDYLDYVGDVSPDKWTRAFFAEGAEAIRDGLSIKNAVPNASAVLFRRRALVETMAHYNRDIASYRVAGDWCVYVNLLRRGGMTFTPAALNYHRRHDASVTIAKFGLKELAEIARMQAFVAREFGVSDARARQARAYLERLVVQFKLPEKCAPSQLEGALRGIVAA